MKTWLKVLLWIIVIGGLVGGSTYYVVNSKVKKDKNNLQTQIDALNIKLTAAQKSLTAAQAAKTVADATADWKTYTNTKYGFSFKYPSTYHYATPTGNTDITFFSTIAITLTNNTEGPITPLTVVISNGTSAQTVIDQEKLAYNFSNYSQSNTTINGLAFTKIGGTAGSGSILENKQRIEAFVLKDSKVFMLIYNGDLGVDTDTFDKIISTFQFAN